jgi:hypothetical protein
MTEGGDEMKITIEVDGGQAQISAPGSSTPQSSSPTSASSEAPPDVLARATATGAIPAGPAPSVPSGPGASSQLPSPQESAAPEATQSGSDTAAGAAPGGAPDVTVQLPAADDDTEEEGD